VRNKTRNSALLPEASTLAEPLLSKRGRSRQNATASRSPDPLRRILEAARVAEGVTQKALTVLSSRRDPYRLDTDAHHRDGKWAAELLTRFYARDRQVHWRGLHYSIIMAKTKVRKPDGAIYANTEQDWIWLSEQAGKAARWLGHIAFDRIVDKRNSPPEIYRRAKTEPFSFLPGFFADIPELTVAPNAQGFVARQAFCFAIFGEKASLAEICVPAAALYEADLYLGTGETSDTFIFQIARDAVADGRPLVVFTLTDSDPSGWQMFISIARKLQAIQDLLFPELRWEIVPVALLPEHKDRYGLPEEPIKKGDKRAAAWKAAFGVEQTEIDALTTPEMTERGILRQLIDDAFATYIDTTLQRRVTQAEARWNRDARAAVNDQVDAAEIERLREEVEDIRGRISAVNDDLSTAVEAVDLPEIDVPQSRVNLESLDGDRQAVIKFDTDWLTATRTLIARKQYLGDGDE
jgi:hypothetical protein